MQSALLRWVEQILDFAMSSRSERAVVQAPKLDMLELVEQARQEWLNTDRYFDCVTDPELVDHAILLKDAAQKKYMYMLRLARAEGLRAFAAEQLVLCLDEEDSAMVEPASAPTSLT